MYKSYKIHNFAAAAALLAIFQESSAIPILLVNQRGLRYIGHIARKVLAFSGVAGQQYRAGFNKFVFFGHKNRTTDPTLAENRIMGLSR